MAWIIASVPFWLLGCICMFGAFVCLRVRHEGETGADQFGQFAAGMICAGILFAIAAWVAVQP